ncbi:MAG: hypothetical protein ACYDG3_07215, partial [Bacillati bacterium]
MLISHEATASLLLRASSPNKIRRQIRKQLNSDSLLEVLELPDLVALRLHEVDALIETEGDQR